MILHFGWADAATIGSGFVFGAFWLYVAGPRILRWWDRRRQAMARPERQGRP